MKKIFKTPIIQDKIEDDGKKLRDYIEEFLEERKIKEDKEYFEDYLKNIAINSNKRINMCRPLIVSRKCRKKITGSAHLENPESFIKTPVLFDTKKLHFTEEERKIIYKEDLILYDKLKYIKNNNEKEYKELCKKEKKIRTIPNVIGIVKEFNNKNKQIDKIDSVNYAGNGGMPRVDIFYKDGKYYAVPIYIADFVKNKLPTVSKPHNEDFPFESKDDDEFYNQYYQFSLFPDELIFIEHEDGNKYLGYYTQYGAQNGVISFESIDRSNSIKVDCRLSKKQKEEYQKNNIDINTVPKYKFDKSKDVSLEQIKYLTKFQVDPLGYITEVKKEKRQGIIRDQRKKKK